MEGDVPGDDLSADDVRSVTLDGAVIAKREQIFISYDHGLGRAQGEDLGERVADALTDRGYSVWWDRRLLTGDWEAQILQAARAADRILTLETARYYTRPMRLGELEIGVEGGKLCRFILEEPGELSERAAPLRERAGASQFHHVDASSDQLGHSIAGKLDIEPEDPPSAAEAAGPKVDITALPVTQRLVGRKEAALAAGPRRRGWRSWRRAGPPAPPPADLFDPPVAALRIANDDQHLPRGLIARAGYLRERDPGRAQEDLGEAFEIAEYGGMRLYLADIALERARLALHGGRRAKARDQAERAAALVRECGYHRRDGEGAALRAALKA
ncbi:MAG: toll/interleukin-1 receptor domain-containing protein [Pseudomonadota bacterium]